MLEAALAALQNIIDPAHLIWLVIGVLMGTFIGLIPGLGGMVGMAILLPFVFGMDPISGIFLLVGLSSITETSDAFPAVLFGIPGTSSAQATIMDGYPLARKGEAGRALGASFSAAMMGGVIGALALFLLLPLARPLVLSAGTPEFLMFTLVGLACVGVVSQGYPALGLLSGLMGLALASVGTATTVLEYRFTFDTLYLRDGLSLIVIALGLFAIPEMLKLLSQNQAVTESIKPGAGVLSGIKDTIRNWPLVARCSTIGIGLGIVPGVGGSVVQWVCYGISARSRKNKVPFGQGEIRGVIAPDSALNAKEGGTMVPTLMFGIPGSGSTAVLLGGIMLLGVQTGPRMVEGDGLVVILSVAWALAVANILAGAICLGLSRWLSLISRVPMRAVTPFLVLTVLLASYQADRLWGSVVQLLVMGLVGWIMLNLRIPRPPLLIGFVLGPSIERNLWISNSTYGADWLLRPGVIAIGVVLIGVVALGVKMARRPDVPAEKVVNK